MSDLAAAEAQWHDWIVAASEAVGVDHSLVDVAMIHALTKDIAHDFARPMAPVGSFILGLAMGRASARPAREGDEAPGRGRGGLETEDLLARLRGTLSPDERSHSHA